MAQRLHRQVKHDLMACRAGGVRLLLQMLRIRQIRKRDKSRKPRRTSRRGGRGAHIVDDNRKSGFARLPFTRPSERRLGAWCKGWHGRKRRKRRQRGFNLVFGQRRRLDHLTKDRFFSRTWRRRRVKSVPKRREIGQMRPLRRGQMNRHAPRQTRAWRGAWARHPDQRRHARRDKQP